jgi:hypothetical protein
MKKLTLWLLAAVALTSTAHGGPEPYSGKEMKQVAPPPCPEWYADKEWNVSLWGTYAFTTNNDDRAPGRPDVEVVAFGRNDKSGVEDISAFWSGDRYLETDHAWGGGVDLKYFFHRYFGIGIEGFVLDARRTSEDVVIGAPINFEDVFSVNKTTEHRAIGAILGTFTLRYPFHCSRFAPYIFGGGGAIFGGGERDVIVGSVATGIGATEHRGTTTKGIGQFGSGLEFRITQHIGLTSDFTWNVVGGPNNNFGIVRSGINFAF